MPLSKKSVPPTQLIIPCVYAATSPGSVPEFEPPEQAPPGRTRPADPPTPGRPARPEPDEIPDPERDPLRSPERRRETGDPDETEPGPEPEIAPSQDIT